MPTIPPHLRYTDTHEWVRLEGPLAVIGITEFAQEQLGDVTFVELPKPGAHFEIGQNIGAVESVKAVGELYCPVPGVVEEINVNLESSPELVNSEPYEGGWMMKIRHSSLPENLLSAEDYAGLIAE